MRTRVAFRAALIGLVLLVGACTGGDDGQDGATATVERQNETATTESVETADVASTEQVAGGNAMNTGGSPIPSPLAVGDRTAGVSGNASRAGNAIEAFGFELFDVVQRAEPVTNLNLSPTSIAVALALVEPGAVGDANRELRAVLGIDEPEAFHLAMNALELDLEARVPGTGGADDPGEVTLRIANAMYLQSGYPFEPAYLETIGGHYGPVVFEVDFSSDPNAVAGEINRLIATETNDRIPELLPPGTIKADHVLAIVNALYLKASWIQPFSTEITTDAPFTLLDGTEVDVPLMMGSGTTSAAGDGWVGATKSYVGDLEAQFILPDEGRFDEIARQLPDVFADLRANATVGSDLGLPRFETRSTTALNEPAKQLGLEATFREGGLTGIADDPRLIIDAIAHQAFVSMDEEGTEAAAATILLFEPTSAAPAEPVPVVLDRPFFYRIVDRRSGATLFIGQVVDPTAG